MVTKLHGNITKIENNKNKSYLVKDIKVTYFSYLTDITYEFVLHISWEKIK